MLFPSARHINSLEYWSIPMKWWLRPDMTEKLTGTKPHYNAVFNTTWPCHGTQNDYFAMSIVNNLIITVYL